jgi:hypothetical protein
MGIVSRILENAVNRFSESPALLVLCVVILALIIFLPNRKEEPRV